MKQLKTVKMDRLDFEKNNGLIPVIVQEYSTRKVLMLAYMNREALQKTLETGLAHYYSRSRKKIWMKGETSGNIQKVRRILVDCDHDTLLIQVEQTGNACHAGEHSCFHNILEEGKKLHDDFDDKIRRKIMKDFDESEIVIKKWVKDSSREEYLYILNPYTEHYRVSKAEVYEWIAEKIDEATPNDIDKIVVPECFGIPIAQLVASRKGKPLAIIRKRPLKPGDRGFKYSSGYETGYYYIYGVEAGDRVLIIDDAISTGGTMIPIINELRKMQVEIKAVASVISKENYSGREIIEKETGIYVYSPIKVYFKNGKVEIEIKKS